MKPQPQWVTVSTKDFNIFREAVEISVRGMRESLEVQVRIFQNLKFVLERGKIESERLQRQLEVLDGIRGQ